MRTVLAASHGVAALFCASQACAQGAPMLSIAAQPLGAALIELGRQTHHTIGGVDTPLSAARSRPVHGRYTIDQALRIMLRGTGFGYRIVDGRTVIIFRAPPPTVLVSAHPPKPRRRPSVGRADTPDIVVTATKRRQMAQNYPGSLHIEQTGEGRLSARRGSDALVARLPVLASTDLGTGRNKLFVRGVADSSFSGPTQSTVGLYLGEMRVTYNAPDPDLRLYDTDHVEVIEGPQGTLYGAGTLGGIVKIVPAAPQVDQLHAAISGGRSATRYGSPGFDGNAMVNLPFGGQVAALRAVGYFQREGGYIANSTTGQRATNRTDVFGGRIALRVVPGDNWTVDIGAVLQDIHADDAQYAQINLPPRTHAANVAQIHDNDFRGFNVVATKQWGSVTLSTSTSYVDHRLDTRYDATGYLLNAGLAVLDEAERISLVSHETHLSGRIGANGSWVGGVSAINSVDAIETALAPLGSSPTRSLLLNRKQEAAGFGEATLPIDVGWAITLGGRLVYATTASQLVRVAVPDIEPTRRQFRVLPTAALSWKAGEGFTAYLRAQSGFRSGGLAESGPLLDKAVAFQADQIDAVELGMRFGRWDRSTAGRITGAAAVSFADWRDVQADVISQYGLPFTSNLGRGRILGFETNLTWMPRDGLTIDLAAFINDNRLTPYTAGSIAAAPLRLPNIANLGARLGWSWTRPVARNLVFQLDGNARYVGSSDLGSPSLMLLPQGDYAIANMAAALLRNRMRWSVEVTNLLDTSANTFSFGNPFTLAQGVQTTPLRPRALRLGWSVRF